MRIVLLIIVTISLYSCSGKKSSVELHTSLDEQAYQKFVNPGNMPKNPNLTIEKSFINEQYPIEIALYDDHRFFYNLPNLGTGKGTWTYKGGKIKLKAKRSLFDLDIEIYGSDATHSQLAIQFSDRFGPNTLKMENNNL